MSFVEPDTIRPSPESVRFWHQMNEDRNVFHRLVDAQSLTPVMDKLIDPCRHLVFGGEMIGTSLRGDKSKWEQDWLVPITRFHAGIDVPGRSLRYLRIELQGNQPHPLLLQRFSVFGEE